MNRSAAGVASNISGKFAGYSIADHAVGTCEAYVAVIGMYMALDDITSDLGL